MSIIKPHTSNRFVAFLTALFLVFLTAGVVYSREYRAFADSRHETERLQKELVILEARHVDLADTVFQAADPTILETTAAASGLSIERRPAYLSLGVTP
ncbi:MAG: hypothetical protein Q7S84_04735 [bacterium]|nr:hypothetical protein [bacterium]